MVGFVMFGFDHDDQRFMLIRVMIDEKHQRRGFGRAAVSKALEKMSENAGCREIYLSFVPENTGAERLYLSLGFERLDEISESGEIVMRYTVANNQSRESEI